MYDCRYSELPAATLTEYQSLFTAGGSENDVMWVFQMSLSASGPTYSLAAQKVVPSVGSSTDGAVIADPEVVAEERACPGRRRRS